MKHLYYIKNDTAVDSFCAVKIADLNYNEKSSRNDDRGELYIAPIVKAGWDAPRGVLAIYATTNGDPIMIGQIEDGEVSWFDTTSNEEGLSEAMRETLSRASWNHPTSGEGYSFIVADALPESVEE